VQVVAALSAVLVRVLQPEQPLRGELAEQLVGEPAVVLPLLRVWRELALDEAADRLSQLFVLVGEGGRGWRHRSREGGCMPNLAQSGYIDCVRRTTLDIDEDMLAKAREILGTRGVKDTVDEALREVVRREAGKRLIAWYKENEDLHNPEIMERAWPRPPIS
jgi:Arc/MetJ family transcription regulator